jgi:hypothetical protein
MAFSHGSACEVVVDEFDETALFRSASFSTAVDTAESTVFRLSDKTYEVGQRRSTISLDGLYDPTRQAEVEARLTAAGPFIATIGPAGLAVGARARLAYVTSTEVTETSGVGDVVLLSWSLQSTEKVGYGYALAKPTVTVVTSTNGAAVDTGAAVTGALWVAHFHLHSISATNVVLKIQGSADGSTGWADLSSAASGTLTAVSAVRVTGTGNTLRHVRAVSTITGGATTASYTVAFSRTAA